MDAFTTIRFEPIRVSGSCRIPLRFGVPFERGQVSPEDLPRLIVEANEAEKLPVSGQVASLWPDGSVCWAWLSITLSAAAASSGELTLGWSDCAATVLSPVRFESTSRNTVAVRSDDRTFHFSAGDDAFGLTIAGDDTNEPDIIIRPELFDRDGVPCSFSGSRLDWNDSDPLRPTVTWHGLADSAMKRCGIELTLTICLHAGTGLVSIACQLGNPAAARHREGRWDLGDPGSVYFRSAALSVALSDGEFENASIALYDASRDESTEFDGPAPWHLLQASSGGDNWQSRVHVDQTNEVRLPYKGYRLTGVDRVAVEGERAEPILHLQSGGVKMELAVCEFWQNFPTGLSVTNRSASLALFPHIDSQVHELQGGERKTQRIWLALGGQREALHWTRNPPLPILDAGYVERTNAVPLFSSAQLPESLEQLVQGGVLGDDSFFAKRERVDEYGWRHFGELYADHETLNYHGDLPLVSHYNNQYDPIESFWRQALRTNSQDWMTLALDLASHVVDIDIYHTDRDRPEYNGGLFWHTDHYVHAHTATHRTYSRYNKTSCDGEAGGGPGTEHCYTSGLVSLYFATGEPDLRDAAHRLIDWAIRLHEGSNGALEFLDRTLRKQLPLLLKVLRRKQIETFRYPLTRGTGNYVSALVDGYLLSGETRYLEAADDVIRQTLHPAEDVDARDLLDSELRWSYLVLLQSLCRYIAVLNSHRLMPESLTYASACVVHFADWIVDNERPFLDHPDQLDFPNETWSAQDMRKAWLLHAAALLHPEAAERYLGAASIFVQEAHRGLVGNPKAAHTRILILLLQNRPADVTGLKSLQVDMSRGHGAVPVWRAGALLRRIGTDLRRAVTHFSLRRELNWIRYRLRDRLPKFSRADD